MRVCDALAVDTLGEPPAGLAERPEESPRSGSLALSGWRDRPVLALAVVALAAGFGQFGAVASLGDVARTFGHISQGRRLADQAGLSGTDLGLGLAVIRLASLGGLLVAGLADRLGRRRLLLAAAGAGLLVTMTAAVSPGYWWFVALFALGRPALSAAISVAQVAAAEETASSSRAKAVALIAGAYGLGSGMTAIVHGLASRSLGFRGLLLLAGLPLAIVLLSRHELREPARFRAVSGGRRLPVLGPIALPLRRRLGVLAGLAFAVAFVTGPANSFIFLYAENVRRLSGVATSAMVAGSGLIGLAGLVLGQRAADRMGRRGAGAIGMALIALSGTVAYSGGRLALVCGYIFGVGFAAFFAPSLGAIANELFPTEVRASTAGWLVAAGVLGGAAGLLAFGALADVGDGFGHAASLTFLPVLPVAAVFFALPETKGREPEEICVPSLAKGRRARRPARSAR